MVICSECEHPRTPQYGIQLVVKGPQKKTAVMDMESLFCTRERRRMGRGTQFGADIGPNLVFAVRQYDKSMKPGPQVEFFTADTVRSHLPVIFEDLYQNGATGGQEWYTNSGRPAQWAEVVARTELRKIPLSNPSQRRILIETDVEDLDGLLKR